LLDVFPKKRYREWFEPDQFVLVEKTLKETLTKDDKNLLKQTLDQISKTLSTLSKAYSRPELGDLIRRPRSNLFNLLGMHSSISTLIQWGSENFFGDGVRVFYDQGTGIYGMGSQYSYTHRKSFHSKALRRFSQIILTSCLCTQR